MSVKSSTGYEALPNMPFQEWQGQPRAVWALVTDMVRDGWFGRVKGYYEGIAIQERRPLMIPENFLTYDCALHIQGVGAPVGRFFTAAAIIVRDRAKGDDA